MKGLIPADDDDFCSYVKNKLAFLIHIKFSLKKMQYLTSILDVGVGFILLFCYWLHLMKGEKELLSVHVKSYEIFTFIVEREKKTWNEIFTFNFCMSTMKFNDFLPFIPFLRVSENHEMLFELILFKKKIHFAWKGRARELVES